MLSVKRLETACGEAGQRQGSENPREAHRIRPRH
jgi:hypothetical protein